MRTAEPLGEIEPIVTAKLSLRYRPCRWGNQISKIDTPMRHALPLDSSDQHPIRFGSYINPYSTRLYSECVFCYDWHPKPA
jgi:hypothetical protein